MPVTSAGGAVLLITLLPATIYLTINYLNQNESNPVTGNRTIRIDLAGQNGPQALALAGSESESSSSKSNIHINIVHPGNANSELSPPEIKVSVVNASSTGGENEIRESSVVKKSVNLDIPFLPTCCYLQVRKDGSRQTLTSCSEAESGTKEMGVWDVPDEYLLRKDGPKIFRLQKRVPSCSSSLISVTLQSSDSNYLLTNSYLKYNNEHYRPNEYCINGFKSNQLQLKFCPQDCSNPETPCVHKCCEFDEVYSLGMHGKRGGCLKLDPLLNETFWSPQFYSSLNRKLSPAQMKEIKYHVIHRNPTSFKPSCPDRMTTVYPHGVKVADFLNSVIRRNLKSLNFQLRQDGWLLHPNSTSKIAISSTKRTTKYCIDGVQNYGEDEKFQNLERQTVLFACSLPDPIPTTTTSTTTTTTTKATTTTTTPTTTTTTPKPPVKLPRLPTCCNLNPADKSHCTKPNDENSVESGTETEWNASPKFMHDIKSQKFSLYKSPLSCKSNWTKAFILNYDYLPGGGSPSLMNNGMLKFQSEFFKAGEFCVNGIFTNILEVLMCNSDCSASSPVPCVNKCCGPTEVYSLGVGVGSDGKRGCVPLDMEKGDEPWTPRLYKDMTSPPKEDGNYHLVQKFPPKFQYKCYKNMTLVFPYKREAVALMSPLAKINLEFRLRSDGKVMYRHPVIKDPSGKRMESVFNNVEYCVDGVKNYGEDTSLPYRTRDEDAVLFVCAMNPPEGSSS